MLGLIECLRAFNRKERYYVVRKLLGEASAAPTLAFCAELGGKLDLIIPADPWWAMDYHLDSIYAALILARDNAPERIYENKNKDKCVIHGHQEDMDLLLAYDERDVSHLIFIEAKGVTAWANQPMKSKMDRLGSIFGPEGKDWPGVVPHLVLMSPRPPRDLNVQAWPQWAVPSGKAAWIELPIPTKLKRVMRCDSKGVPDKTGAFWTVVS
jgi:hypothetical protein